MGRFDVELPIDVEDSAWDILDPKNNYPLKTPQSEGRPGVLGHVLLGIKLVKVLSFAMRTVVSH